MPMCISCGNRLYLSSSEVYLLYCGYKDLEVRCTHCDKQHLITMETIFDVKEVK